jgi:hypothetical protein
LGSFYQALEQWSLTDLNLQRFASVFTDDSSSGPYTDKINNLRVLADKDNYHVLVGSFTISTFDIGKISGVALATFNNYRITDAYFGSHIISGITYSWAKGERWP